MAHVRDPPLLVRLLHVLGRWLGIIKRSSGGDMQRPYAPPGLESARQPLGELPGLLSAYDKGVPTQLRTASDADLPLPAFDASIPAVDAPVASLEADMLALEAPAVDDLQPV
jgi:hypothetical protein